MGKILLIEDKGIVANEIKKKLQKEIEINENDIIDCYNSTSAIGAWGKYKDEVDCIILDLNIDSKGLRKELGDKTVDEYYLVPGILLLKIFEKDKDRIEICEKTIIHSAYLDTLEKKPMMQESFYNKLIQISKLEGISIFDTVDDVKVILTKKKKSV